MITPYLVKQALKSLEQVQPSPEIMFTDASLLATDLTSLIIGGHSSLPVCPIVTNGRIELSMHYGHGLQKHSYLGYQAWIRELTTHWLAHYIDASDRLRMINLGGQVLNLFLPIQLDFRDFQADNLIDLSIFSDKQLAMVKFREFVGTVAVPLPFFGGDTALELTEVLGVDCYSLSFAQVILGVFKEALSSHKVNSAIAFLVLSDSECPGIDFIGRLFCLFANGQTDECLALKKQGMDLLTQPKKLCTERGVWTLINCLPFFAYPHLILTDFIESLDVDGVWELNQSAKNVHMTITCCLKSELFLKYCGKVQKLQTLQNTLCRVIEQTEPLIDEEWFWWLPGAKLDFT